MTTLEDCYARIGADAADVVRRLGGEERVRKVLAVVLRDGSMDALRAALADGDHDAAFTAAHTLKGIFVNLGFDELAAADAALVEALRERRPGNETMPLFAEVDRLHRSMLSAVRALLEEPRAQGADR